MKADELLFKTYRVLRQRNLITAESMEALAHAPRPDTICGVRIPANLNAMTLDTLTDLLATKGNELEAIKVITGIEPQRLDKCLAVDVVGVANFIRDELKRIADLFRQLRPTYTAEERQAGIEDLDFGFFGTVDWYARRMGITDHDEVMQVGWLKVWQCAKIDKENQDFQRRLQKVYNNQNAKP